MRPRLLLGACTLLVAASSATATTAPAAPPGGVVLFPVEWPRTLADIDPAGPTTVICGVGLDGRSYRLTTAVRGVQQSEPSWSPEGTAFAFASEGQVGAGGTEAAISIRTLGPDPRRGIDHAEWPAWSPAETQLAFQAPPDSTEGSPTSIFVGGLDGSGRHAVAAARGPASWSPDGTQLAYGGGSGIHVVGGDGSGDRVLARDADPDVSPAWSPDGRTVAFVHERGRLSAGELTLVGADGTGRRPVAPGLAGMFPAWSPDGSLLAFIGGEGVSVVAPDGSGKRLLFRGSVGGVFGGGLSWQPVAHPQLLRGLPPCTISGDAHHHVLHGSRFGDVIYGTSAGDRIDGGPGADVIEAGGGNDTILVRDGVRDQVSCGSGRDTVVADRRDLVARDCEHVSRR